MSEKVVAVDFACYDGNRIHVCFIPAIPKPHRIQRIDSKTMSAWFASASTKYISRPLSPKTARPTQRPRGATARNLRRHPASLLLAGSLAVYLSSCQTARGPEGKSITGESVSPAEKVYETQKSLARNSIETGKAAAATQQIRQLLQAHPKDPELFALLGLAHLTLKSTARAIRAFNTAYEMDQSVGQGLNLSSAYIEAGQYNKAAALLKHLQKQAAQENYPHLERVMQNLGLVAAKLHRWTTAERWFKLALEENPGYFPSHLELGRLYVQTKRPALAMAAYRQAVDYCKVCLEPIRSLSSLYVANGRGVEARKLLLTYLRQEKLPEFERTEATRLLKLASLGGQLPEPASF